MNTLDAAVTATFMWNGALEAGATADELYETWGMGAIELHQELSQYALLSEEILDLMPNKNFPGAYDYEVSEPFGAWFATKMLESSAPDFEEAKRYLVERVVEFFARGESGVTVEQILGDWNERKR